MFCSIYFVIITSFLSIFLCKSTIDNGRITIDEAATSVNMTVEDFIKKREEYKKETL